MICPQCGTENPEGAIFCLHCGARLALACRQCNTELPPEARFCFACGAELGAPPVTRPTPPAERAVERLQRLVPREYAERLLATRGQISPERRTVTMLFSDVKGSTAMAENLDPEEVLEIMDGAFDLLIGPVYRYEATLARLMGDAVLAFFGAPIAHEDDPERACRAALEITTRARRYAQKLARERGIQGFNVRVGIHTGLVVVGEVGSDLRVEYTAMGDAVNLAARMESAAEPGTVLVSEDTYKLIAPLFDTEALGRIEVKGRSEPVSVYRVLAPKVDAEKLRGVSGLESPLVGREPEYSALQEAVKRLEAGVGGIVTIVGEAGIGKSRLTAELRKEALSLNPNLNLSPQWVEGRCLSYGTSMAYLLWLDVLRSILGMSAENSPVAVRDSLRHLVQALCPDQLDDVYPYLSRAMSLPLEAEDEAGLTELEGEQLRTGTFQAVETLLACAAGERPLVLVCEDLHWADGVSLELLERLLALIDRAALLIICVFRPDRSHGSWRLREFAARLYPHRHTDLRLNPLSAAESEMLVGNLLRVECLSQKLKWRILSHAEGNPFYVEEVIRSLIDMGAIVRDEASDSWQATQDVASIPIPDTLQGVLMARIDRLQDEAKRVLQMAAVIGRIFLYRVLAAIAREERELSGHLLTLQREEMIHERARQPELEYIFKHELMREVAYNGLLKKERRVFHRQVAEVLERLFPERIEELVGLLAHHWERAGEAEKATGCLLRAGDQARLAYAHEEAIDYYQRSLAFLKEQAEHERAARTLMKLGLTYYSAFDFETARRAYEEGFALWQRVGEMEPALPPRPAPHALRMKWSDPYTLDPTLARETVSGGVTYELFSGLVEYTPDMGVVPEVARSWEVLEGGRKYVFHLRDDVRWTDGTPLTAGDFEYAWKRVLNPATGAPIVELFYDIKGARAFHEGEVDDLDQVGVRALDEVTLVVELEKPISLYLLGLAAWMMRPIPRHMVEEHGKAWTEVEKIVTYGPFKLESWRRGQSMVLVRNPDYRGRFTGNVQRVELSLLWEGSDPLKMYEAKDLDVLDLDSLALPEKDRARQRHAGEYLSGPVPATQYVGFNVSRPPFDDSRVRRAFVMAADRKRLADVILRGYQFPATGGFVPPGTPGYSAGIGLSCDPEQARQLLAEAGYPGGRDFPVVKAHAHHYFRPVGDYLQAQWRENLGVEIRWHILDSGVLWDKASPDIFHWSWIGGFDPMDFLQTCTMRQDAQWESETYDGLIEEATQVTDPGERMRLAGQADKILIEEAAVMPLTYVRSHLLLKPWVRRFPTSPVRGWFWKDVIIEPH